MRALAALLLVSTLVLAGGKDKKDADGDKSTDLKKVIAGGLADLGKWCQPKKLNVEGRALVAEALELDPENAVAKGLKDGMAGDSAADDAAKKEYEGKLATYGKKLAPLYVELSRQKHDAKLDAAYDGYLLRAYQMDRKAVGPIVDAAWRDASGKKDWERAHRLLGGAERIHSEPARVPALKDVELKCAEKTPILKQASGRDNFYWLALPRDWSPAKKWPIFVYVEGAGANFKGAIDNFAANYRKDFNCIVITPQTFSSTNNLQEQKAKYNYSNEILQKYEGDAEGRLRFDEAGLLQILEDVRKEYGGEDKIYITGFSGGGNLTWRMVFGHPEMLWAAAPACPNFYMPLEPSAAPEREKLPVKVFQGDKDEYLTSALDPQWLKSKKFADENGWKNITREMVPGAGHSPCWDEVLKFFKSVPKK